MSVIIKNTIRSYIYLCFTPLLRTIHIHNTNLTNNSEHCSLYKYFTLTVTLFLNTFKLLSPQNVGFLRFENAFLFWMGSLPCCPALHSTSPFGSTRFQFRPAAARCCAITRRDVDWLEPRGAHTLIGEPTALLRASSSSARRCLQHDA